MDGIVVISWGQSHMLYSIAWRSHIKIIPVSWGQGQRYPEGLRQIEREERCPWEVRATESHQCPQRASSQVWQLYMVTFLRAKSKILCHYPGQKCVSRVNNDTSPLIMESFNILPSQYIKWIVLVTIRPTEKSAKERLTLRSQWSNRQRYFIYWWSDKYSSNMRPCRKCLVSGTDIHFCRSGLQTLMCLRINWSACLKCRFLTQKFWVSGLRWSSGTCLFIYLF